MNINLKKCTFLDENVLNPNCHRCGNETGAFLISEDEVERKFTDEVLSWFLENDMIKIHIEYPGNYLIYICLKCYNGERIKNDKG